MFKKIITTFVFLISFHAMANEWPTLKRAELELKRTNYKSAVDLVSPLLEHLKLSTVEEISKGHKILGIARCELGDIGRAKEHFETLNVFSPNEIINDDETSTTCKKLFTETKQKSLPPDEQKLESEPEPQVPKIDTVLPKQSEEKPTPTLNKSSLKLNTDQLTSNKIPEWKLWMPLGVGQFEKGEPAKGYAFLTTQSVFFSTAIASFTLFKLQRNDNGSFKDVDRAHLYRSMFWSTLGAGIVSYIWGIFDSHSKK